MLFNSQRRGRARAGIGGTGSCDGFQNRDRVVDVDALIAVHIRGGKGITGQRFKARDMAQHQNRIIDGHGFVAVHVAGFRLIGRGELADFQDQNRADRPVGQFPRVIVILLNGGKVILALILDTRRIDRRIQRIGFRDIRIAVQRRGMPERRFSIVCQVNLNALGSLGNRSGLYRNDSRGNRERSGKH